MYILSVFAILIITSEPFKDSFLSLSFVVFILLVVYFVACTYGLDLSHSSDPFLYTTFFSSLLLIGGCMPHLVLISLFLKKKKKKKKNCLKKFMTESYLPITLKFIF